MTKVLLINPPFNILKANYDSSISVGLMCLASYLDQKGIEVKIIDGARQKNYLSLIKNQLPLVDFVGISVMTTQVGPALEVSKIAKDFNKNLPVIWGGLHPTFFPKETVSHPDIDIVVIGEGEQTLWEIIQGLPLEKISGLAFKKGNLGQINQPRVLMEMDQLPLPNWQLMPIEVLDHLALVPTHTSRGCPHRCAFCINAIRKNRWRARNSVSVLKDLKIIKNHKSFQDKPIRFWDEDFFVDKQRALDIIDGMIDKKLNLVWETTVRADYISDKMIDDDFLKKLRQSGCYLLSFGAESGSDQILKKIKKDLIVKQILNSARKCLEYDIIPQYSFMVGLPAETKKDMMQTIDLIDQLVKLSPKIQILGPQAFRPYPGSELYNQCLDAGWQPPKTLEQWASVMRHELNYLSPKNFPWLDNPDFVDSLEAYTRFGAHSIRNALSSTVKANKILKLLFIIICKIRWKLKFFSWPIEVKIAKKFVS